MGASSSASIIRISARPLTRKRLARMTAGSVGSLASSKCPKALEIAVSNSFFALVRMNSLLAARELFRELQNIAIR
jgi:hypothetical protein